LIAAGAQTLLRRIASAARHALEGDRKDFMGRRSC
jgi:hypothetical protein